MVSSESAVTQKYILQSEYSHSVNALFGRWTSQLQAASSFGYNIDMYDLNRFACLGPCLCGISVRISQV